MVAIWPSWTGYGRPHIRAAQGLCAENVILIDPIINSANVDGNEKQRGRDKLAHGATFHVTIPIDAAPVRNAA